MHVNRLVLLVPLFVACANANQAARSIRPRKNLVDPAPAVRLLQDARFDEAEAKARAILAGDPPNAQAHVVVAMVGYHRAMRQAILDMMSVGEAAFRGLGINHQYARFALQTADDGLAAADVHLMAAGTDGGFTLDLCLACWRYDWNRNGRIDYRDEALFQVEVDADGHALPQDDPRRRPIFRFDVGDIHWARAMLLFQRAAVNLVLAYDWHDLDKLVAGGHDEPDVLTLRLIDKVRVAKAKTLVLDGLAAAELSRQLYLAETDDFNEWVPNPRQRSHPMPLPVDEALYDTWGAVLADLGRLLAGKQGLDVAQLAQLGGHQWSRPPEGYINLGKLFDQPGDVVLRRAVFEAMDRADRADPAPAQAALRDLFGDKYTKAMTPSPLIGHLLRMKREMDRGQESFERKLRYLIWLN